MELPFSLMAQDVQSPFRSVVSIHLNMGTYNGCAVDGFGYAAAPVEFGVRAQHQAEPTARRIDDIDDLQLCLTVLRQFKRSLQGDLVFRQRVNNAKDFPKTHHDVFESLSVRVACVGGE